MDNNKLNKFLNELLNEQILTCKMYDDLISLKPVNITYDKLCVMLQNEEAMNIGNTLRIQYSSDGTYWIKFYN